MTAYLSQNDAILALLRTRPEGLTPIDALRDVGCLRLAARVAELRARGEPIVTTNETRDGKTYARYRYVVPENEQRALWGDR